MTIHEAFQAVLYALNGVRFDDATLAVAFDIHKEGIAERVAEEYVNLAEVSE